MTPAETRDWLWSRCTPCGDCLLWDRAVDDGGVPQVRLPGSRKVSSARRVLLEALGRDITGRIATTKCGDQLCMAEQHVVAWTRKQLQKRSAKKFASSLLRSARLATARRRTAKLTLEDAHELRRLRADGVSTREAAERFGVAQSTAAKAMRGESWRDYGGLFTGLLAPKRVMPGRSA